MKHLALIFFLATLASAQSITSGVTISASGAPAPTLVGITVTPLSATIGTGTTQGFTATGSYSDGSVNDVTSACTWTSSDATIATIAAASNPQIVNGVKAGGPVNITCTIGLVSGVGTLTVSAVLIVIPSVIPDGVVSTAYTTTFGASGGTAPYTFSITSGLAGLTGIGLAFVSPTLSGTLGALTQGSYAFTVHVVDSSSPTNTSDRSYILQVNNAAGSTGFASPPALPQNWVANRNGDTPSPCNLGNNCVQKFIHTDGSGDFPCSQAGIISAYAAWPGNVYWLVSVDDSLSVATGGRCQINGTNSTSAAEFSGAKSSTPTSWFRLTSAHPLTTGQFACLHGTRALDYLNGTVVRNPGCNTTFNDVSHMYYLHGVGVLNAINNGTGAALDFAGQDATSGDGISHIIVSNAEIDVCGGKVAVAPCANNPNQYAGIVLDTHNNCAVLANLPHDIGLEYNYIHGTYDDALNSTSAEQTIRFLKLGCGSGCWIMYNYWEKIMQANAESHIIGATDNAGTVKTVKNFFEGAAINMMHGGGNPVVPNTVPLDEEIRENIFTTNPAWMTAAGSCTAGDSHNLAKKSLFELKVASRMLIEGNVFEWSDACGQQGQCVTFNVRSSSGGSNTDNYSAVISDLTFAHNVCRHTGSGIENSGRSTGNGAGLTTSLPLNREAMHDNLFYDLGNKPNHTGATPTFAFRSGTGLGSNQYAELNVARTSNVVTLNLVDGGTGFHQTDTNVGDPVQIFGCSDSSFNTATGGLGPLAVAPTNPNGLQVSYPSPGPNVLSGVVTGCVFKNIQGAGFSVAYYHNTVIGQDPSTAAPPAWPGSPAPKTGGYQWKTYQRDNLVTYDVAAPYAQNYLHCCGTGVVAGEGGLSEALMWDVDTIYFDHNVFPGRAALASQYIAYPSGLNGSNTSSNLWFPAAEVCPGATVGASDCIGYAGMMSGVAFNINSSTPLVDYALVADSPYKAGNARQASDGNSMGANMNDISTAMTETSYASHCDTTHPAFVNYCGPVGPQTD